MGCNLVSGDRNQNKPFPKFHSEVELLPIVEIHLDANSWLLKWLFFIHERISNVVNLASHIHNWGMPITIWYGDTPSAIHCCTAASQLSFNLWDDEVVSIVDSFLFLYYGALWLVINSWWPWRFSILESITKDTLLYDTHYADQRL